MRRRTATERTDFEAMRIGLPSAWASMNLALARSASRSTKANGGRDGVEDRLVARVERLAVGSWEPLSGDWCRSRSPRRERIECRSLGPGGRH